MVPAHRHRVRIVSKIFAAIVMGLVGWFVIGFPIMLVVLPSLAADPNPSVGWAFLGPGIAVVATIAVTVFAPTGRIAWGRLCLLNGVVSLGLPLAGIAFSVLLGHHASQLAMSDAAKTGAKIGAGLGGLIVSGTLGFVSNASRCPCVPHAVQLGSGTDGSQTPRWRELDSNFPYASAMNLVFAPFVSRSIVRVLPEAHPTMAMRVTRPTRLASARP